MQNFTPLFLHFYLLPSTFFDRRLLPLCVSLSLFHVIYILQTYIGNGTDAFGYVGLDTVGKRIVVAFKGTSDAHDWVRERESRGVV